MLTALCPLLLLATAAQPAPPTVDQLVALRWPEDVRLSPDGALVALVMGETDWEENAFRTHISLIDTASGHSYPLTQGKKGCHTPRWSPDSRWLAFLSDRDGSTQVHVIAPRGGEAVPLTAHDTGIESFAWSPDGQRLAFVAADPDSPEQRQRQEKYGAIEVFEEDRVRKHLWLVDVPATPRG
jgi:dipeptidyl aminopeptidase/acylaminoacyl peptidase